MSSGVVVIDRDRASGAAALPPPPPLPPPPLAPPRTGGADEELLGVLELSIWDCWSRVVEVVLSKARPFEPLLTMECEGRHHLLCKPGLGKLPACRSPLAARRSRSARLGKQS